MTAQAPDSDMTRTEKYPAETEEIRIMPALWLYPLLALMLTAFAFLAAAGCVRGLFAALCLAFGQENVYWIKHLVRDSAGFALLSAAIAVGHYFLASSLVLALKDAALAFSVLAFSASASGVFFMKIAAGSSFGVSRLCGVPVAAACLFGGLVALFQAEGENPLRGRKFNPFR